MTSVFDALPSCVVGAMNGDVAELRLSRPDKRNALDDTMIAGIEMFLDRLPAEAKAVVLHAQGEHFSAGLDLTELTIRKTSEAIAHSRNWHRVFRHIEFGRVPVVAVMHGAVVGGGLELVASCHIRVAERSAYYALPEGSRGIFVGGGGSVRISRLVGVSRMMEMMMTGRTYDADQGFAFGLSHYVVEDGTGLEKGLALARQVSGNAPMTNYALMHALPRIAGSDPDAGLMMESLMSAIASTEPEAQGRLQAFLAKRAPKVVRN
ncbi:crotonase/enoyl-CoA hydratase family protein [Microbacteriaceae bacterium K1510]|nr:crotonase/enoyl-CoA hydratase family protein [Microbacteriaceae bacterium K1510]